MEILLDKTTENPKAQLILAHGAGAAMDTPFMNTVARGVSLGGIDVKRFEFPYMEGRRVDGKKRGPNTSKVLQQTWREIIKQESNTSPLFIGGKSMGGRISSMISDEPGISGIICLGYPFHPIGKPEKLRTEHLEDISLPTLIIQGERDPFGKPVEVETYELSDMISINWIPDGDHSFKPRKKSGLTEGENLGLAIKEMVRFIDRIVS